MKANQDVMTGKNGSKQVLVTGGGGFLGSAIAVRLIEQGLKVRSFSRNHYPKLERMGVEQIRGDLADPHALEKACRHTTAVFHTAAKAGVWGPWNDFYRTNYLGTCNVIRACRKCKVPYLIYTSSPSVVFNGRDMEAVNESVPYPESYHAHYPKTKAMAEKAVVEAAGQDLATICLRPHLIWGPGDNHLVPRILARAKRLARIGDGKNKVDTIYIDNAAHAHLLAWQALCRNPGLSGKVYFISQDEPIELWKMIDLILAAGGKPPVKKKISAAGAYLLGTFLELGYKVLGIRQEPPLTRFVARELATSHWFDITAAKQDLGYRPLVSTRQGLARLAKWLRENEDLLSS